jgi:hypothetical protein
MIMKRKKRGKFLKMVLIGMFVYLILFTCVCLYITYKTGVEPNTLITCVFTFCGVEGGLSAWIRNTKEKKKDMRDKKMEEDEY